MLIRERLHLVVGPLQLIHEIQATVHDEGIHVACLLGETGNAISSLLGGAKFKLEEWLVSGADNAEIVGHVVRLRKATGKNALA